jgi:hypothetical protein
VAGYQGVSRHRATTISACEWVWKNVKSDHVAREVPQRPGHLFEIARRALRKLHAVPAKIRAFADPHLAYFRRAYA